ncbi:hypothetical protein Rsub_09493 [Raphidocelis subcapitata]|uniref:FAS1 domain-containing protein n=1 Tax=Raphidocelis subcapitata TaxID=307507 RepID=A0A2V0PGI6_9CHLO|nr:hypothetical protein Rsub_09493 [Raphidocelis subcapitata]|eukprot:GBF97020.1 hypothetical protein Rsub_09493 [Raphidocelis subcapitata]
MLSSSHRNARPGSHSSRGPAAMRTAALVVVCLLSLAAPARALAPGGMNVTSAKNALVGIQMFPQVSVIETVIRGDDFMRGYLSQEGRVFTGFVPNDAATKALLREVGRYAGVALQNETFTRAVFRGMIVPGRAMSLDDLRAAAPLDLATLNGEPLRVTKDPSAPGGVLVGGFPILVSNVTTADKKAVMFVVDGVLVPPSQKQQLDWWIANAHGAAKAGAAAAAGSGGGAVVEAGPKAAAAASGAAARAGPALAAAAAAAAMVLGAVL